MIRDAVVRPVVRAYLLIDVALPYLVSFKLIFLGCLSLLKNLIKAFSQFLKGPRLIRVLVSLILASGYHTSGFMRRSHRTIRFVNVLISFSSM